MKFLDVKTDYAFKRVFGSTESVPLLISFLNAILDYTGDGAIVDLTILDPYLAPKLQGMKDTYVDVRAKLKNGNSVIVEMQVLNVQGFEQRVLYNAAKEFSNQLTAGQAYKLLNPVIALTFTDFKLFDDISHYQSNFVMQEKSRFIQYSDDIELVFVELPKFNKNENELDDIKDKWIYFVKNAGKLDYIPVALKEPCIEEALSMVNEASLSREELELQYRRYDFIRLQQGSLALAEEKGKQEGILEIAHNLLDVLDDVTIAHKTGLTIEQIKAMRTKK
jgi:predicted transposase/invertase (TIGR01784 family)